MRQKSTTPREALLASQFNFIVIELELALTFWSIAQSARDERRAARNIHHAMRAYTSALRFLDDAKLTAEMREVVNWKLRQLRPLMTSGKSAIAL
jgi:hypothetical protein